MAFQLMSQSVTVSLFF